jgi:spermidine/putrescine transport system ATP-binding protein
MNNIIEMIGVSKQYNERNGSRFEALAPSDINIRTGEFFTLLGPSGCGKTTALRIIAGFIKPTTGELYINKVLMNDIPPYKRPVNMVFQDYALFPHLSVFDNVAFGLNIKKVPTSEKKQRVQEALEIVQLQGYDNRRPNQLSGGQRQRVALARALVNKPSVLLLDEPLGALDLKLRRAMQIELKSLQKKVGITFIYVTHDQEEALTMSDRIAVMNKGNILQVDTPMNIYERPATRFVADFVGETNFITGKIATIEKDIVRVAIGENLVNVFHNTNSIHHGDQITVAIRPEKLSFAAQGQSGETLPVQISEVTFLGTDTRYIVNMPTGEKAAIRVQNANRFALPSYNIGDEVSVNYNMKDAQILTN